MKRTNSKHPHHGAASVPPSIRVAIRRKLLRWYDRNQRDLPWRRRKNDPYAQWVAEIMLQQTRVETVLNYYDRFLDRFPTVQHLANARDEDVLKQWEGLGYYRRVHLLQQAAKQLCEQQACIPRSASQLRTLPGVGEYTSKAIASIAFGERAAAVDGNVARVIARLFRITEDVYSTIGKAAIQGIADALIPRQRPGDFNQAWMDLGSSVCMPKNPTCPHCPLRTNCCAFGTSAVHELPVRHANHTKSKPEIHLVVGVIRRRGRWLVRQRPLGGLWSGLWEFPNEPCESGTSKERAIRTLVRNEGVAIERFDACAATVRHQLTHRTMIFDAYVLQGKARRTARPKTSSSWTTRKRLDEIPMSTAHRKIMIAVGMQT